MKFRFLPLVVFYFFGSPAWATENYLSLQTHLLLKQYSSSKSAKSLDADTDENVHLILLVSDLFDIFSLDSLDIAVQSDFDSILTVVSPMKSLPALVNLNGIKYIRAGMPVKSKLNIAVPAISADKVIKGIDLNKEYNGEGVIIGLVDFGLDFTHPDFFSADGKLRISRAWIQSEGRSSGKNVKYGKEYIGQSALLSKEASRIDNSHGTHVCGIAAGGGGSSIYKGVAPGAEIVFVETGGSDIEILDAVRYIFNHADSEGKPAVVNISLGTHFGPHDGRSFIDVNLDKLSGEGKIVVGAAGNEGYLDMHIQHSFSALTDTLRTVIEMDKNVNYSYVDIWGDANTKLDVAIEIYEIRTKEIVYSTSFGSTASNYKLEKTWYDTRGRSINVSLYSQAKYASNEKPNIEMRVDNSIYTDYAVALLLKGSTGKRVDLWNCGEGYGAQLTTLAGTNKTGWTAGIKTGTVGEIGGTGNKVISVGAYVSKNEWTDLSGKIRYSSSDIGDISFYSSMGPTADGRTKPDVTAPGSLVVSALNSFDPEYSMYGINRNMLVYRDVKGPYYGIMEGTSMAAPMVTGSVALMLQKNPKLTSDDVKALMREYSNQDSHTGVIDENGSNIWGYGKLNVHEMMKSKAVNRIPGIKNVIVYNETDKSIGFGVNIDTEIEAPITRIEIFTIAGQKIIDKNVSADDIIDLSHCQSGVLLVKVYSGKKSIVRKIVVF